VPDLAVRMDERDQLAAIIAGSMAACYTCYTVIRDIRKDQLHKTESDLEQMQPLTGNEADEEGDLGLQRRSVFLPRAEAIV